MRVLVTGTSGHVGGSIAAHLVREGREVIGLSRRDAAPPGIAQHVCADLCSETFAEDARAATQPCTVIIHAAASLSMDALDPAVPATNCAGLQRVLALAAAWEVSRLVFLSSIPVVGRPRELPITEEHPTAPETVYHATKLFGEHAVQAFARHHAGVSAVSLRLPSPVGPGMMENRILPIFVKRALSGEPLKILGRGSRKQNYIDARDIARAAALACESNASGVFNIAAQTSISNLELAERCIACCRSSSCIQYLDKPDPQEGTDWDISTDKAARLLGFQALVPIEDTIRILKETYAYRTAQ